MSFYIGVDGSLKALRAERVIAVRKAAGVAAEPKLKEQKVAKFKAVKGPKTVPKVKASKACKSPAKSKFKPSKNARA